MSGVGGFDIRGKEDTLMAPSQRCSGCRSGFMACREREIGYEVFGITKLRVSKH